MSFRIGILGLLCASLVACGGGSVDEPASANDTQALQAIEHVATSPTGERRQALGFPVPGLTARAAADQVMDLAESVLPSYFPVHAATRVVGDWFYRYYPTTGIYVAVINWDLYVLGGPFGPEVVAVGPLSSFVSAPPAGPALSNLYGNFTLRYRFTPGTGTIYSDTVAFSALSLSSDKKTLATTVTGSVTRAIACQVDPSGRYDFLCVIIDANATFPSTEIFLFKMNGSGVSSGIYEYCSGGVSVTECTTDLLTTPDGEVLSTSGVGVSSSEVRPLAGGSSDADGPSKYEQKQRADGAASALSRLRGMSLAPQAEALAEKASAAQGHRGAAQR